MPRFARKDMMLEERYLIWRFKHGSAAAFERIYEKYKTDLLKLAVVLLGETCAAEDVVHDVFVHVARTRANLRITGNLKALLTTAIGTPPPSSCRAVASERTTGKPP